MKRLSILFATLALAACAGMTANSAALQALNGITAARQISQAAYDDGTITAAQDTANQAALTMARQSVMSAKSAADVQAAQAKADAIAANPGSHEMTDTTMQQAAADAQVALAALAPFAPLLGPNAGLAAAAATTLTNLLATAAATGADVSDADLTAALSRDDAAIAADAADHSARGDAGGGAKPT